MPWVLYVLFSFRPKENNGPHNALKTFLLGCLTTTNTTISAIASNADMAAILNFQPTAEKSTTALTPINTNRKSAPQTSCP